MKLVLTLSFYRIHLPKIEGEPTEGILFERKVLKRLIEYEDEILNTIKVPDTKGCNYLLNDFISKCVEHLQEKEVEINPEKIYPIIKVFPKSSFQSEIFLKFWSLVSREIINNLVRLEKSEVVL